MLAERIEGAAQPVGNARYSRFGSRAGPNHRFAQIIGAFMTGLQPFMIGFPISWALPQADMNRAFGAFWIQRVRRAAVVRVMASLSHKDLLGSRAAVH